VTLAPAAGRAAAGAGGPSPSVGAVVEAAEGRGGGAGAGADVGAGAGAEVGAEADNDASMGVGTDTVVGPTEEKVRSRRGTGDVMVAAAMGAGGVTEVKRELAAGEIGVRTGATGGGGDGG